MFVLLVVLGVAVFAGIAYLAISKKSSFKVRIAALAALGLMVLTIIVCIFIIFGVPVVEAGEAVVLDMPPTDMPPPAESGGNVLLMFVFFLLAMFVLVLVLSLREQRNKNRMQAKGL